MNKLKLLLFFLLIAQDYIHSQEVITNEKQEDSACVRECWLTIYKGNDDFLFQSSEKLDIYEEIKRLLLDGEIRLWTENSHNSEWLTSPLPSMLHDSISYLGDSLYYNVYFDYQSLGEETLKTASGEDSMYMYADESQAFLYPLPKYEPVTFDKISEIRIKEILVYDSINKLSYLKPSLIAFDVYTIHHNILFWVKVDDLIKKLVINKNWIEYIEQKKYTGFVYKRYSCNDPDYQWKKVYH
jgi:hypothetical protein